jgi:hypothetical protein
VKAAIHLAVAFIALELLARPILGGFGSWADAALLAVACVVVLLTRRV